MLTVPKSVEAVRWIAEDNRPFAILGDKRLRKLMKTGPGRPEMYLLSPTTVLRDLCKIFVMTRKRLEFQFVDVAYINKLKLRTSFYDEWNVTRNGPSVQ